MIYVPLEIIGEIISYFHKFKQLKQFMLGCNTWYEFIMLGNYHCNIPFNVCYDTYRCYDMVPMKIIKCPNYVQVIDMNHHNFTASNMGHTIDLRKTVIPRLRTIIINIDSIWQNDNPKYVRNECKGQNRNSAPKRYDVITDKMYTVSVENTINTCNYWNDIAHNDMLDDDISDDISNDDILHYTVKVNNGNEFYILTPNQCPLSSEFNITYTEGSFFISEQLCKQQKIIKKYRDYLDDDFENNIILNRTLQHVSIHDNKSCINNDHIYELCIKRYYTYYQNKFEFWSKDIENTITFYKMNLKLSNYLYSDKKYKINSHSDVDMLDIIEYHNPRYMAHTKYYIDMLVYTDIELDKCHKYFRKLHNVSNDTIVYIIEPKNKFELDTGLNNPTYIRHKFNKITHDIFIKFDNEQEFPKYNHHKSLTSYWELPVNVLICGSIITKLMNKNINETHYKHSDIDIVVVCDSSKFNLKKYVKKHIYPKINGDYKIKQINKHKVHLCSDALPTLEIFWIYNYISSFIKSFHSNCIKALYDFKNLYVYPSFVKSMVTGVNRLNPRGVFYSTKYSSVEIVHKYFKRGFSYALNKYDLDIIKQYFDDIHENYTIRKNIGSYLD